MSCVVAIVTAAGKGKRAGGPKALFVDAAGQGLALLHARALLAGRADIAVVTPVDKLPADADLVRALVAHVRGGAGAPRPVHSGRGGHPVTVR